jgi:hypothetical protein
MLLQHAEDSKPNPLTLCRQAEQQFHQGEEEWVPGAGWFAWATKPSTKPDAGQVDRLRAELRTEFNAAVRHAYLGPR